MSFELHIWSPNPIAFPRGFQQPDKWEEEKSGSRVYRKTSWQIIVSHSVEALAEDVPEEVLSVTSNIHFLTELILEPIGAPKEAYEFLQKVSRDLATHIEGVIEDPQSELVVTPGKKAVRPKVKVVSEDCSLLVLSWWFLKGPLAEQDGWSRFMGFLEKALPEALPRRYGQYEPPQYSWKENGKEHFLKFLSENKSNTIVWQPYKPLTGVYVGLPKDVGYTTLGKERRFRSNSLSFSIDFELASGPDWDERLPRVWRELSQFIKPFYGDVRILRHHVRQRGRYWVVGKSERHPVTVWWWSGIPRMLGQAIVVGPEYSRAWPTLAKDGTQANGLYFIDSGNWRNETDLSSRIGTAPAHLRPDTSPEWMPKLIGNISPLAKEIPLS